MERLFLTIGGVMGALAVGLGAFGAHGLRTFLSEVEDGVARRGYWETAAHYHLVHALAIALVGYVAGRGAGISAAVAGWAFVGGILLFSGSLYAMTLTGLRSLGAITPLGGLLFIGGWIALAVAGWTVR